jgi:hypothetical protein
MNAKKLFLVLTALLLLAQGCATPPTMKKIKGHTSEDGHVTEEPQPAYYAVLPFAVLYDVVAAPILYLGLMLGVNSGLVKP